jgi:hypothetical protein
MRPEAEWPCKRTFGLAPTEEMQKDMVAVACPASAVDRGHGEEEDDLFKVVKRGDRLIYKRVYRYVFAAVYNWIMKSGAA